MSDSIPTNGRKENAGFHHGLDSVVWPAVGILMMAGLVMFNYRLAAQGVGELPWGSGLTNGLLREYWRNIPGIAVHDLTASPDFPLRPAGASVCANFETSNFGESYGERLRGTLQAPVTGEYTFWIASDDTSALWLSSDDNPAHKHRIAQVSLFTAAHEFTRYWEQRSDPIRLEGGKHYYIEALHKQGLGVDHLSVAWAPPGSVRELIPGRWLQPWENGLPGEGVTRERWPSTEAGHSAVPAEGTKMIVEQQVDCAAPGAMFSGDQNLHQRLRGYLHPPTSGSYIFAISDGHLMIGTDDTPAHKRVVSEEPVALAAGRSYYFEAVPAGLGGAISIGWQMPDGLRQIPISARYLTPYDSDYDGLPDWYEVRHGLDPYNPDDAIADTDGDGLSNLEEFQRGSNPQKAENFTNLPPLLSVKQIREPEAGRLVQIGEGVQLRGIVTYCFHNRDFYIQDGTGGVYVEARNNLAQPLLPGELIKLGGVVASEGASASVALAKLTMLGQEVCPSARSVALDPLYEGLVGKVDFAGAADGERVEIEGIVRSAAIQDDWINGRNLVLKVVTTSGQFDIRCPEVGARTLDGWVDTSIRVRGVASIKPQPRSIGLVIYAPRQADIWVAAEPASDIFAAPMRTIRSLAKYYWRDVGHRVCVEGVVLYSDAGRMLFVRDETGALQVFTGQGETVRRGDRVRIVGFPTPGDYSAVLTDAVIKKMDGTVKVAGVAGDPADILNGKLNCDLVTLQGRLIDHLFNSDKQGFWVKTAETVFDAYWNATNGLPGAAKFEKDSILKITGIAMLQDSGLTKGPQTFHLLLSSVEGVEILQQPPWLTWGRLFWISILLASFILLATTWVMFLSKRKKVLEAEIVRRQRAEENLQQAHRELEKRMTAELREEIGRRERGEAEFQAVLVERTRIAQELHDTLEQGLVGIALQLDNVADVVGSDLELAQAHLETARRLVDHSQADTRRSVWDLRSPTLEQGDLGTALKKLAVEMGAGGNPGIEVTSHGEAVKLPVLVENNLFRIGQEALTNAVKHARARRLEVRLEYGAGVVIVEVRDDGAGFDPRQPVEDGRHFGLQGLRERTKRIGGTVDIDSAPGGGTRIRVAVPLAAGSAGPAQPANSANPS